MFMSVKTADRNATLVQRMEPNTVRMPKLVPEIIKTYCCWLNQIQDMFYAPVICIPDSPRARAKVPGLNNL